MKSNAHLSNPPRGGLVTPCGELKAYLEAIFKPMFFKHVVPSLQTIQKLRGYAFNPKKATSKLDFQAIIGTTGKLLATQYPQIKKPDIHKLAAAVAAASL